MDRRRAVEIGCLTWAITGLWLAVAALPGANEDARLALGVASVFFPLCALGAMSAIRSQMDRLGGLLLLLSVATPTYFAYVANVPALFAGVVLLVRPSILGMSVDVSTVPPQIVS